MKHLEEHILQSDMTRNDIMLYYTTVSAAEKKCACYAFVLILWLWATV